MKDLWGRWSDGGPARRKSEGVPLVPFLPPGLISSSFCPSHLLSLSDETFSLSLSLLVRATPVHPPLPSLLLLCDASRGADQRDFCLKHDLSLKYLKPDYLWVCHLGRDVTPTGRWQAPSIASCPPFLPSPVRQFFSLFFGKSDAPMQVKSHAFEFSP